MFSVHKKLNSRVNVVVCIVCRPESLGVEASIMWQALNQFDLQHLQTTECHLGERQQITQGAIQGGCNNNNTYH